MRKIFLGMSIFCILHCNIVRDLFFSASCGIGASTVFDDSIMEDQAEVGVCGIAYIRAVTSSVSFSEIEILSCYFSSQNKFVGLDVINNRHYTSLASMKMGSSLILKRFMNISPFVMLMIDQKEIKSNCKNGEYLKIIATNPKFGIGLNTTFYIGRTEINGEICLSRYIGRLTEVYNLYNTASGYMNTASDLALKEKMIISRKGNINFSSYLSITLYDEAFRNGIYVRMSYHSYGFGSVDLNRTIVSPGSTILKSNVEPKYTNMLSVSMGYIYVIF
ncbi:MAG: hypothetical protein KAH32_04055 [Chlamydiia bacterium]|nr:hypothetical protein [Chlamydiia bacterium]